MNEMTSKILIIDDEPLILSSLSEILYDKYDVLKAEEGFSGLSMFKQACPSLVLLDIDLPFLSGIEVLKNIRESNGHVPVLVLTGRNSTVADDMNLSWTTECAKLGISGYLTKPVSPVKLLNEIEAALKGGIW